MTSRCLGRPASRALGARLAPQIMGRRGSTSKSFCAVMRRLFVLLVWLLWWSYVSSQSGSGDLQCLTLAIGGETFFDVFPGTVCFHCVFGGVVATDAVFEINSDDIDPSEGTVVNGTLVVFDSERVFNTITTTLVSCKMSSDTLLMIGARLSLKILRPPVITGETTVSEGDTLSLSCDTRNSHPNPQTLWLNPDGDIVASPFGNVNVMNINRSMGGVYTCVARLLSDSTTTMNSSVNVIVQFLDPPLVLGETVVDEGGTLNLICNASNSNPLLSVHWLNPDGEMVGDGGFLDIVNIHSGMGGPYTCLASLNSSNVTINTTVTVTIQVHCAALTSTDAITVNVTSTIVGSNATYHCRDEPSNIHTTQCTGGVWEPNPNVTLDCTKPADTSSDEIEGLQFGLMVGLGIMAIILLSLTIVVLAMFASKKNTQHKGRIQLIESCMEVPETTEKTPVSTAQVQSVELELQQMTELNGKCSVVQKGPEQAEPSGQCSEVRKGPKPTTELNGQCSKVQTQPKQTTELNGQCSKVKQEPQQTSDLTVVSRSSQQDQLQKTQGEEGDCSVSSVKPSTPPPPVPPVIAPVKDVVYAELGPQICPTTRPPPPQTERVEYASIVHTAVGESKPLPQAELKQNPDDSVSLDQILIQLNEVSPHWSSLAETVGLDDDVVDRIAEYVSTDSEAMVEVVDNWLAKVYPKKPTWREIADAVETVGHHKLADSLRQVYITGLLPIEVTNAVPVIEKSVPVVPPPLPPRETSNDGDNPSQQLPPPLPEKPRT